MTFAIFIVLALGLFVGLLNFLPVAQSLPSEFASSIIYVIGTMKAWDFLLPITELFVCVGIVVTYEVAIWTYLHVAIPVVKFVRGSHAG